jgi:hypothetical protein
MSLTTPPTMVEKVLLQHPARKRLTSIPAYVGVTAQINWNMTKRTPVTTKMGRLPLISEKGASTMGAMPNPQVKVVIPTAIAVSETFHSSCI